METQPQAAKQPKHIENVYCPRMYVFKAFPWCCPQEEITMFSLIPRSSFKNEELQKSIQLQPVGQ